MSHFTGVTILLWEQEEETGDSEYPTDTRAYAAVFFPDLLSFKRADSAGVCKFNADVVGSDPNGNPVLFYYGNDGADDLRKWIEEECRALIEGGARVETLDHAPYRGFHTDATGALGTVTADGAFFHHNDDTTVAIVVFHNPSPATIALVDASVASRNDANVYHAKGVATVVLDSERALEEWASDWAITLPIDPA